MARQQKFGENEIPDEQNNIYWFLRYLAAADYNSFAVNNPSETRKLGRKIASNIEKEKSLSDIRETVSSTILDAVNEFYQGRRTKKYAKTEDLVEQILLRLNSVEDARDLQLACEAVVRTKEVRERAPEFDEETMEKIVRDTVEDGGNAYSPENGYLALQKVDEEGTKLQAGGQNQALVPYIEELINDSSVESERERARLISAVAQEYERRAANKRKSDAGGVLEEALNMVFDCFDIPVTGEPRHFGDFEIDNMLVTDEATIGFSCKRTLRERFRQSLTREAEIDIDEVWFVPLSTDDISEEKIIDIQDDGGRVYVSRDTYQWEEYGEDPDITALRPGDEFLSDLEETADIELDCDLN